MHLRILALFGALAAAGIGPTVTQALTIIDTHGFHVVDATGPDFETYEVRNGDCFYFSPEGPCIPSFPAPAHVEFRNTGRFVAIEVHETSRVDLVGGSIGVVELRDDSTLHVRLPDDGERGGAVLAHDDAVVEVHTGEYRNVRMLDRAHLSIVGGAVGHVELHDAAHLAHSGGVPERDGGFGENFVVLFDDATMEMTGGAIANGGIIAYGRASIEMNGGLVPILDINGDTEMTVIGGTIDVDLAIRDRAQLQLTGSGFAIDGEPVGPGAVAQTGGQITGDLAQGGYVSARLIRTGDAVLTLVPEPRSALSGAFALAIFAGLERWRRRSC